MYWADQDLEPRCPTISESRWEGEEPLDFTDPFEMSVSPRTDLSAVRGKAGRPSKLRGSYYLRRGWEQIARSVYLLRMMEKIEKGYAKSGEAFLADLALVWVSGDGTRELALKGRALRELLAK
ncbi:MAG TPA: hypothetical protein VF960_05855 [Chloroflexota bacterium]